MPIPHAKRLVQMVFETDASAVRKLSNERPTIRKTGTIAAAERFNDGFSAGNDRDRMDGIINKGIETRVKISNQCRCRI